MAGIRTCQPSATGSGSRSSRAFRPGRPSSERTSRQCPVAHIVKVVSSLDVREHSRERSVDGVSATSDSASAPIVPGARLVTISAAYGAGGSVVAPALAHRLAVPFLQRATTTDGGLAASAVSTEALGPDEERGGPVHWLLASLTQTMPTGTTLSPPTYEHQAAELRQGSEAGIRRLADEGGGVILGRGAAVVLGKERGLHVRLDGPTESRVLQGAEIEGISREEARDHQQRSDRARTNFVCRLYHVDPADPSLYHLVIDSTAVPLDTVVEIILQAGSAFAERAAKL